MGGSGGGPGGNDRGLPPGKLPKGLGRGPRGLLLDRDRTGRGDGNARYDEQAERQHRAGEAGVWTPAGEDGRDPPLELRGMYDGERQRPRTARQAGGQEEEVPGVVRGPRAEREHLFVAGLLARERRVPRGDPREGVEPVEGEHGSANQLPKRVPPAHMGEFVGEYHGAPLRAPRRRRSGKQDHRPPPTSGHRRRHRLAGEEPDVAAEAQPVPQRRGLAPPFGVAHRGRRPHQSPEPEGRDRQRGERKGAPDQPHDPRDPGERAPRGTVRRARALPVRAQPRPFRRLPHLGRLQIRDQTAGLDGGTD